jgi:tetratricopeptide (TPR) repeat protein
VNALASLFWIGLLLPGFAIARRVAPRELEGGPLPSVAVAFLAACAALVLPTVVGYAVHVPTGLAALALGAFLAWGAFDLVRSGAWRAIGPALLAALGVGLAILLVDLVFSWRHGAVLAADARVHLARIRFLYDHGLSNLDPFVAGGHPYPIYHTNLHHALFAAGSRMVGLDPLEFWFASLPAAKLLIASGMAYLTWAILGGRWAAWVAVTMVVVHRGPFTFSLYPNQLAPWFLVPVAVAVAVRATGTDAGWSRRRTFLSVGAVAATLGMFHPMYAGFALVLLGPTLAATAAWRGLRRRPGADRALVAIAAIAACGLPFPLVARAWTVTERTPVAMAKPAEAAAEDAVPVDDAPGVAPDETATAEARALAAPPPVAAPAKPPFTVERGFTLHPADDPADARIARTFGRSFTGHAAGGRLPAWRLWVLAIGTACAVGIARRPQAWIPLGAIATVMTIVLVPEFCTAAIRVLGATWMIERFETLAFVLWIPLSAPAVAAALEPRIRWRPVQEALTLAAIPLALVHASHRAPYDWAFYRNRVAQPESSRLGRELRPLLRVQALLRETIPPGATVLAQTFVGTRLRMLHDLTLVASERSSNGVPDGRTRRAHVDEMLRMDTEESRRAELFRKYGVDRYVVREEPGDWSAWWTGERRRGRGYTVLTLRDEPDPDALWIRELKLATRAVRRGNLDEGIERLTALSVQRPGSETVWFTLGNALLARDEPRPAAEAFERAERLAPTDPRYPLMHGNARSLLEDFAGAAASFERTYGLALAEDNRPFASTAQFNLGNALYGLDRLEDALAAYERAIELDPTHGKARLARGWLREDLGLDPPPAPVQSAPGDGAPAADGTIAPSSSPTP